MDPYYTPGVTPFGEFLILVLCGLAVLLIVLWILLPFAVFGIKERLDKQIKLLEELRQK